MKAILSQISTLAGASLALAIAGITASGLSQTLEQWSPFFYGLTAVLLIYSFWEGFLRAPRACEDDPDCATERGPTSRGRSTQMKVFFVAHLVLVALILSVPTLMMSGSTGSASAAELMTIEEAEPELKLTTITVAISGMTCGGCVATIERALNGLDGMHHASVSVREAQGAMIFDEEKLSIEEILGRLTDEGYGASLLEDQVENQVEDQAEVE